MGTASREPSGLTSAAGGHADVGTPADADVAGRDSRSGAEEQPSPIIYIREPRDQPELATAILALVLTLVAGLVLGGSAVLIWDTHRHTDACSQVGPHVVWDQGAYRCVHQPVR